MGKKVYFVGKGRNTVFHLVTEDGEPLASHFCTNEHFAEGDLYYNRPERKEEYKKRFGEIELLWIGDDDMTVEELIKRNREWFKNQTEVIK